MATTMSRELLTLRGKAGAHALHAKHDPRETTAKARIRFNDRFYREVDPDGALAKRDPRELERRVESARKAYFAGLAFKSVQSRQAKAERRRQEKQIAA